MIKKSITVLFLLINLISGAQNWAPVSNIFLDSAPEKVFYDSLHNELIVSDNLLNKAGNIIIRGIARWNGIKWDSMAGGINTHDKTFNPYSPNGQINDCISYQGQTLFGGYFESIGGLNVRSLALWDGIKWDTLPKRAFRQEDNSINAVKGFFKKGTLLYFYGAFDTIAGQPTSNIATWDGVNFNPVILPFPTNDDGGIYKMTEYKNELYICGRFTNFGSDITLNRILKYNGSSWVSVGGGIQGSAQAEDMVIYKNELYVCGNWDKLAGNAGSDIMKWDGNQWHNVGYGDYVFSGLAKMLVHHDKLWVFGYTKQVAGMPAYHAAVYDGINWCTLDTLDNILLGAAVYKDTIYIGGGFKKASGDTNARYIAKLKDENFSLQCVNVGIEENSLQNQQIKIYPNPVSNILHIKMEHNEFIKPEVEIMNALGQVVLKTIYSSEMDVSSLPSGYYILRLKTAYEQLHYSKFIKE